MFSTLKQMFTLKTLPQDLTSEAKEDASAKINELIKTHGSSQCQTETGDVYKQLSKALSSLSPNDFIDIVSSCVVTRNNEKLYRLLNKYRMKALDKILPDLEKHPSKLNDKLFYDALDQLLPIDENTHQKNRFFELLYSEEKKHHKTKGKEGYYNPYFRKSTQTQTFLDNKEDRDDLYHFAHAMVIK